MEKGNKVLFVDGDIRTDVFLGKYKLGKSAKGVLDYIKLAVGVDTNGIITGVYILSSEHTERFASKIIPCNYFFVKR